jgi:hypothetical protein
MTGYDRQFHFSGEKEGKSRKFWAETSFPPFTLEISFAVARGQGRGPQKASAG